MVNNTKKKECWWKILKKLKHNILCRVMQCYIKINFYIKLQKNAIYTIKSTHCNNKKNTLINHILVMAVSIKPVFE